MEDLVGVVVVVDHCKICTRSEITSVFVIFLHVSYIPTNDRGILNRCGLRSCLNLSGSAFFIPWGVIFSEPKKVKMSASAMSGDPSPRLLRDFFPSTTSGPSESSYLGSARSVPSW